MGKSRLTIDKLSELEGINQALFVISFSADGTILDANERFLSAIGEHLEEIQGKHIYIFAGDKKEAGRDIVGWWNSLEPGESTSAVFEWTKKNGDSIWLKAICNPIFDWNRNLEKVTVYAMDRSKTVDLSSVAYDNSNRVLENTHEMIASLAKVSDDMGICHRAADDLLRKSREALEISHEFKSSASDMRVMIPTFKSIARHVNLIALNGAIEATRMGEPGSGFATVATEAKAVAVEAAEATDIICDQVEQVEKVALRAVNQANAIASAVETICAIVTEISTALENQNRAALELSADTKAVSASVEEITNHMKLEPAI